MFAQMIYLLLILISHYALQVALTHLHPIQTPIPPTATDISPHTPPLLQCWSKTVFE